MTQPHRIGKGMIWVGSLLALGLLTAFFQGFLDSQRNPNSRVEGRVVGEVREVVLKANRQSHYVATAQINGVPVEVLIDTGATQVAVSRALADELELPVGAAVMVSTANGLTTAHETRIRRIQLGTIELRDVNATIVPNMSDPDVLLGMNFLGDLELTQRNGELILRQL